jgi:molybdate transport system substrate-binding protein
MDARAALTLAATAQVDAAIVYATDAASTERVRVVASVEPQLHAPIEYPLLLLQGAREAATPLFDFLASARGRAHFIDRGFAESGS